jgi:alpha,alpha-trehalase
MDFTPRFEHRCAEFAAVDLNSNLYIYEQNFAWIEKQLGISDGEKWEEKAQVRKDLINKYCWDESRGLYLDYDYINKRTSKVASVMTFAPLYANIASHQQAGQVVANMNLLESEWGLVTTEDAKEERIYQWDHVGVWAPMQSLTIIGLDNYGFKSDAKRVAMKYLDLVANNFISPNPAWYLNDKKDTIKRSKGLVFEKYTREGKINDREYKANTMMGWSAGTFAFAFAYLNKNK